jgi:hypothetical protein
MGIQLVIEIFGSENYKKFIYGLLFCPNPKALNLVNKFRAFYLSALTSVQKW